jgi:hypothetical protein
MSSRRKLHTSSRSKTCPDCGGDIEVIRGVQDGTTVIRKADVRIMYRPSCPQWQRRARQHGAHPDITELVHEDDQVRISEWCVS